MHLFLYKSAFQFIKIYKINSIKLKSLVQNQNRIKYEICLLKYFLFPQVSLWIKEETICWEMWPLRNLQLAGPMTSRGDFRNPSQGTRPLKGEGGRSFEWSTVSVSVKKSYVENWFKNSASFVCVFFLGWGSRGSYYWQTKSCFGEG